MADYYAILGRTLAGLGETNEPLRLKLYDRARKTISAQLSASALDEKGRNAELATLEDAIKRIEREQRGEAIEDVAALAEAARTDEPVEAPPEEVEDAAEKTKETSGTKSNTGRKRKATAKKTTTKKAATPKKAPAKKAPPKKTAAKTKKKVEESKAESTEVKSTVSKSAVVVEDVSKDLGSGDTGGDFLTSDMGSPTVSSQPDTITASAPETVIEPEDMIIASTSGSTTERLKHSNDEFPEGLVGSAQSQSDSVEAEMSELMTEEPAFEDAAVTSVPENVATNVDPGTLSMPPAGGMDELDALAAELAAAPPAQHEKELAATGRLPEGAAMGLPQGSINLNPNVGLPPESDFTQVPPASPMPQPVPPHGRPLPSGDRPGFSEQIPPAAPSGPALGVPELPPSVTRQPRKKGGGVLSSMLAALVGVAVIGGGAYALWQNKEELFGVGLPTTIEGKVGDDAKPEVKQSSETTAPAIKNEERASVEAPAKIEEQAPKSASEETTPASKFDQRLSETGQEVDPEPLPEVVFTPPASNTDPEEAPEPVVPNPIIVDPAPAPSNDTETANAPIIGQRAFLYEEAVGQSRETADTGSVIWQLSERIPADGQPAEPAIVGKYEIPSRGLKLELVLRRNTDSALPASHIIDLNFTTPKDFAGGAVADIRQFRLKLNEQDRGQSLVAVPAKIADGVYLIALNNLPEAIARNSQLLQERGWIDILVSYRSGRQALVTIEKGSTGQKVFNEAFNAWAAKVQ